MKAGFSDEVKRMIYFAQGGYCASEDCYNSIHSVHHCLHDTEYYRDKYPLFIHSPFNAKGLCEKCHTNLQHKFRINTNQAEMYEEWLQELKRGRK